MSSPPPNPTPFHLSSRHKPFKPLNPSIFQTTTPYPPPTQRQQQQQSRTHHQQQSPAAGVLYPVASSGRGLTSHSDGFPPRPVSGYPYAANVPPVQTFHQLATLSSAHLQQTLMGVSVSANPKVVAQSSIFDDNGIKNLRDKNGDDTFVTIRDRKVQVSEGTSIYAQCRSWLKNGFTTENQPQYADHVKSLPKPLPASTVDVRKEDDTEKDESIENVEHLSAKEILQQHVKHAKKVRVRLRNQRLQRIERFKDRLALLLPPVVDQQPKNDPA